MDLTAEVDRDNRILVVHVTGTYRRPHEGYEAQRFVIDTFPEYGCRRVLLDLTGAKVVAGTMATFETANPPPEVANELRRFVFAAVYARITDDERFFETAAVNRGLRVRIFTDLDAAVRWLLATPAQAPGEEDVRYLA